MATNAETLVTRAEYNTLINPTTGRRALVMDGETIELGSTGPRNITALTISGVVASGSLWLERIGYTTALRFENLRLATGDGTTNEGLISSSAPGLNFAGFRPRSAEWKTMKARSDGHTIRINVAPTGSVQVHFALADSPIYGSVMWLTEAGWPASLPGVAAGEASVL